MKDTNQENYEQWNNYSIVNRGSYYILQFSKDSVSRKLLFWKEPKFSDEIMVKMPPYSNDFFTLGNLPEEAVWQKNYDSLSYTDMHSMIQVIYNYKLDRLSASNNTVSVYINHRGERHMVRYSAACDDNHLIPITCFNNWYYVSDEEEKWQRKLNDHVQVTEKKWERLLKKRLKDN